MGPWLLLLILALAAFVLGFSHGRELAVHYRRSLADRRTCSCTHFATRPHLSRLQRRRRNLSSTLGCACSAASRAADRWASEDRGCPAGIGWHHMDGRGRPKQISGGVVTAVKSLWAMVQGDPVFMRRVNGWLTIFWIVMIPMSLAMHWLTSVVYVSALSLWALVSGHWSAWQAARVEVNQQTEEKKREPKTCPATSSTGSSPRPTSKPTGPKPPPREHHCGTHRQGDLRGDPRRRLRPAGPDPVTEAVRRDPGSGAVRGLGQPHRHLPVLRPQRWPACCRGDDRRSSRTRGVLPTGPGYRAPVRNAARFLARSGRLGRWWRWARQSWPPLSRRGRPRPPRSAQRAAGQASPGPR